MARPLFVLLAALAALVAVTAYAQSQLSIIPVSEIRPGMRGYGLTVFRGTEPERFDVEVIDVLHDFRPDMDLILIRTPHPILDRASSVGGMSGSPIYLDGRLAGAYAYGWPFGLDPIAGVTPIQSMLAELDRPVRGPSFPADRSLAQLRPPSRPAPIPSSRLPAYRGETHSAFDSLTAHARAYAPQDVEAATLQPAATPIMLGGFGDATARLLSERLEPFGLMPVQAGGSGGPAARGPTSFVNGGSLAVQLIRGDISATGVGTVTHVAGARLLAFGHPMMNGGEVGFPTATSRVLHILASRARSFKLAEALTPLGTLIHDRQPAIVVDTQRSAPTVPVTVRLHGIVGAPRTEWNFEVATHRALAPLLVFSGLTNALQAVGADATDIIYRAESRIDIEGHGTVELTDEGYMQSGPVDAQSLSNLRVFSVMEAAYGNPFREASVHSIEIDLHIEYSRDVFNIVDAQVPTPEVDPGSTVPVRVVIQRYAHPDEVRVIPVDIPMSAAGETIDILVEPGSVTTIPQPEPRSLRDIIERVRTRLPASTLVTSVQVPTRGLQFRGHVVSALPASALDTLQLTTDSARTQPFVTESRHFVDAGHVTDGFARVRVEVRETPER